MSRKTKIASKGEIGRNSNPYGYQGNSRSRYGFDSNYDDSDVDVLESDSQDSKRKSDAELEDKLYNLLDKISRKLNQQPAQSVYATSTLTKNKNEEEELKQKTSEEVTEHSLDKQDTEAKTSENSKTSSDTSVDKSKPKEGFAITSTPANQDNVSQSSETPQIADSKSSSLSSGSSTRLTDMGDAAKDGGVARSKSKDEILKDLERQHLDIVSGKQISKGGKGVSNLETNEKKKESAEIKLEKTHEAVEEKKADKVAESNRQQVQTVDEVVTPEVKSDDAKTTFNDALESSLPESVEDVDEFKNRKVASKIGDQVKATIEEKTKEVSGTFETLDKTPKPAEPKQSIPFSPIEKADQTELLNLGKDLVPKVDDKSIDLKSYVDESDNLLAREGIKQEHLDLATSGDLAEAKKVQGTIEARSAEAPSEIRKEEKEIHSEGETELLTKESQGKKEMQAEREAHLSGARGHQVGTKDSLEKKKEEVTNHINKIYEDTNKTVQDKLENLKKNSLETFAREEASASAAFEENVRLRMDKFKEKRYSGAGSLLKKGYDWLMGLDDLPEVKLIFEEEKAAFVRKIDAAISKIISDSQLVIEECKSLIKQARKEIEEYVTGLEPALQKIGEDAQSEIQKKLDELDEKVNKAAEELKEALDKKRSEVIANIDKKIEAMKEEMSGFLSQMGDLLLDAALKFFKWALEAAGHSADEIIAIINKGKAVLTAVVSDPVKFLKNLASAVGGGIKSFGANIQKHLGEGFMTWLTGQLNSLPIQLPEKFDLKGIFSLVMQVLGLTYANLRGKLSDKVGEDKVALAEKSVDVVMEVKEKGPIAMYDMMAEKADSIKTEFIDGAKEWAIGAMIKQGLIRLATMLNPAGAIVQAVLAIYNGVIFFVNNWDRIMDFVNSIFDSIASIANGAISTASAFIENTMAKTIPLILDFIAQQLNLSGIAERITKIIHRIRKPIDEVIDKVIAFITNKVKKIADKILGKDKKKGGKHSDDHKEDGEQTKKDFDKDKGDDKTTDIDRKMHKKFANEIISELKTKNHQKEFDKIYNEKSEKAKQLETEYNAKLKDGIQTTITFENKESAKKDEIISVHIHIGPNNEDRKADINAKGEGDQLDQTVHFTGADGKDHDIHLKDDGKTTTIKLEPEEQSVEAYVKSLGDEVEKDKRALAISLVSKIKTITKHEVTEDERKDIIKYMTDLSKVLMEIVGLKMADVPEKADWDFGDGDGDRHANVDKLSYKTTGGGTPPQGAETKGWTLLQDKGLTAKDWVQMHLIMEKLGGPGLGKNLIPGPKSVNSGLLMKTYEDTLRKLFKKTHSDGENAKVPVVMWIRSSVTSFYPASNEPGASYDDTTFGKSASLAAGFYFPKGKDNWVKDPEPKVMQRSIPIPKPDFENARIPNINYLGVTALKDLSGGAAYAIMKERDLNGLFTTFAHFEQRMDGKIEEGKIDSILQLVKDKKLVIQDHK